MLYQSPGVGGLHRVHGCLVTDEEVEETVNFLKSQRTAEYDETILQSLTSEEPAGGDDDEPVDELYDKAVSIVAEAQQASVSMVQRRLRIGYNRASRLVEKMEQEGIVGPADGAKPRAVLIQSL
jgi:S-DNA-T family DNA segregation ATPase FtsK/SpoIIIE